MAHRAPRHSPSALPLSDSDAATLLGRDFVAAVVVFHELVGRCLGVSATDRKCLDLISRGPVTAGELARFTGLTTGAVTGIIDRLVKAGYAERISDPDDRRRVVVVRKSPSRLDEIVPAIFGPLSDDMAAVMATYTGRSSARSPTSSPAFAKSWSPILRASSARSTRGEGTFAHAEPNCQGATGGQWDPTSSCRFLRCAIRRTAAPSEGNPATCRTLAPCADA